MPDPRGILFELLRPEVIFNYLRELQVIQISYFCLSTSRAQGDVAGKLVDGLCAMGMADEGRVPVAKLPYCGCSCRIVLTPFYGVGIGHHIIRLNFVQDVTHSSQPI